MGLINEEKVKSFRIEAYSKMYKVSDLDIKEMPQSFIHASFNDGIFEGIRFAESELKNLAIEFAEWIIKDHSISKWNGYNHFEDKEGMAYKVSELFTKFIEQRNK